MKDEFRKYSNHGAEIIAKDDLDRHYKNNSVQLGGSLTREWFIGHYNDIHIPDPFDSDGSPAVGAVVLIKNLYDDRGPDEGKGTDLNYICNSKRVRKKKEAKKEFTKQNMLLK